MGVSWLLYLYSSLLLWLVLRLTHWSTCNNSYEHLFLIGMHVVLPCVLDAIYDVCTCISNHGYTWYIQNFAAIPSLELFHMRNMPTSHQKDELQYLPATLLFILISETSDTISASLFAFLRMGKQVLSTRSVSACLTWLSSSSMGKHGRVLWSAAKPATRKLNSATTR